MDTHHVVSYGLLLLCCFVCTQAYGLRTYYMEDLCTQNHPAVTIHIASTEYGGFDTSGIIKATRSKKYQTNFTCTLTLIPYSGNNIIFAIRRIDFRLGCKDKLTLSGGSGFIQNKKEYCSDISDNMESTVFETLGSSWSVNFTTSLSWDPYTYSGFELTFTAYSGLSIGSSCMSSEYKCDNFKCISKILTCDGHNHCGDRSDQNRCNIGNDGDDYGRNENGNWAIGIIAALVVSGVLLIFFVAGIVHIWNKRTASARTTVHLPPQQLYHIDTHEQESHDNDLPPPYHGIYPPPKENDQPPPKENDQPPPPYSSNLVQKGTVKY